MIEQDIPPAIACSRCGSPSCEGCFPEEQPDSQTSSPPAQEGRLPWEASRAPSYLQTLIDTSLMTAHPEQACFKSNREGSLIRALHFALMAETLAIVSFALPWLAGFALLFPALTLQIAQTAELRWTATAILVLLVGFVVLLHLFWGAVLEWCTRFFGRVPAYALGSRLGLYACGWDLTASPAGVFLMWWFYDFKSAAMGLKHTRRAPRLALRAYLGEARQIEAPDQKRILLYCFLIVGLTFLLFVIGTMSYLVWLLLLSHFYINPWDLLRPL